MVQQQSAETQYQQGQRVGVGLPEDQEGPCPGYHPGREKVTLGPNQQKTGLI